MVATLAVVIPVMAVLAALALPLARQEMLSLGRLQLLAPRWLLLLALVPALVIPRALTLVEGMELSRRRGALALVMRLLLAVVVIVALARPALPGAATPPCTVVLADVSASIDDAALAAEQRIVDRVAAASGSGEPPRVVTFAAGPALLQSSDGSRPRLARHPPSPAVSPGAAGRITSTETNPATEQSDPAAAVVLAPSLCAAASGARALLLSDGNETRGDLLAAAAAVAGRLQLDAIAVGGDSRRLRVRRIAAPPTALLSAPFPVEIEVESAMKRKALIELLRGDAVVRSVAVDLPAGTSHHSLRLEIDEAGTALLRARVRPPGPSPAAPGARFLDDEAVAAVVVKGRPRVLYTDGEPGADAPLARLLRADGFEVEARAPAALPASTRELARFDLLVLSDVAAASLGSARLGAIASFVEGGGGLLFAGGERVHGAGGYGGSALERVLPVRFDVERRRDEPRLALVLAIDRSGTMEGEKLAVAKEAARATAAILGGDDQLGIIAFDSAASVVVPLQRAGNRRAILDGIARLVANGGTSFLPPLREAYAQLAPARAAVRHVILLTDGQASYEGIAELCEQMERESITVSAVGVGPGADRTLLSMVAQRGGGRFFFADDPQSVPQIFARETRAAAGSALAEEGSRVRATWRGVRLLAGVDVAAAPMLRGHVAASAAADAEVILVAGRAARGATTRTGDPGGPDARDGAGGAGDGGEPILARRRSGAGQVAVWTSDLKPRWASEWIAWPGFARLFVQLARASMRPQPSAAGTGGGATSSVRAEVTTDRGERITAWADVLDDNERLLDDLDSTLEVTEAGVAGATVRAVEMSQVAPGRYQAALAVESAAAPGPRAWVVRAIHRARRARSAGLHDGALVATSTTTVARPGSPEHARSTPDAARLAAAAERTGGHLLDAEHPVLTALPPARPQPVEVRSILLLAAAALLVIDLLARRLPH